MIGAPGKKSPWLLILFLALSFGTGLVLVMATRTNSELRSRASYASPTPSRPPTSPSVSPWPSTSPAPTNTPNPLEQLCILFKICAPRGSVIRPENPQETGCEGGGGWYTPGGILICDEPEPNANNCTSVNENNECVN